MYTRIISTYPVKCACGHASEEREYFALGIRCNDNGVEKRITLRLSMSDYESLTDPEALFSELSSAARRGGQPA